MFEFALILTLVCLCSFINCCEVQSSTKVGGSHAPCCFCPGDLVFEDNFENFDLSKWEHEVTLSGGGNWEFQWYTNNRSNSYVENGVLYLIPTLTADQIGEKGLSSKVINLWGGSPASTCTDPSYYGCVRVGTAQNILNPIKSARIRTFSSFYFTYGRVEVRAKMPEGDWLWPAIWLLPRFNAYGDWPASGEIDITEVRGNTKLTLNDEDIGVQQSGSTLHWGPSSSGDKYLLTHWTENNENGYNSDFHIYGMDWTPEGVSFSIDNKIIGKIEPNSSFWEFGNFTDSGNKNPWTTTKMAPFDQHFYIIINLAVGGVTYFPDDAVNGNGKKSWKNNSPTALTDFWNGRSSWLPTWKGKKSSLQIDYVKVYAI